MTTRINSIRNNRGFSLAEVLIALILTGLVTTALFGTYITQHKNYIVQDDITEIQQAARASIDELQRQIRMAGYELPQGMAYLVAANTDPDTITLAYANEGCDTYLSAAMPQPSSELKCATDVSCFSAGQWVYIFEPDSGGGEFFEITHVQPGSNHLQHNTMTLSKAYSQDAVILSVTQAKFFIDSTTDASRPCLMMQLLGQPAQVYAENISDLQFRYRLTNGMIVDLPPVLEDIRQIDITVTGRSRNPEVDREGHDNYRYRTYTSSVALRNLGV
ncbi:MAG: prepilin-type N-terminal cleavage/methylation domain-containing protein [Candidatus Zixiibacteriota bacterium]